MDRNYIEKSTCHGPQLSIAQIFVRIIGNEGRDFLDMNLVVDYNGSESEQRGL